MGTSMCWSSLFHYCLKSTFFKEKGLRGVYPPNAAVMYVGGGLPSPCRMLGGVNAPNTVAVYWGGVYPPQRQLEGSGKGGEDLASMLTAVTELGQQQGLVVGSNGGLADQTEVAVAQQLAQAGA